jgi:plasmid stabilization system protein ParE
VRQPRHFILYRPLEDQNVIDVGRILYDGRDLQLHLPDEYRPIKNDK